MPRKSAAARAFSIPELLVVLGIVLVLLGLFLPGLGRARALARATTATAAAQQIAIVVAAYAGDNREMLPATYLPIEGYVWRDAPQPHPSGYREGYWFDNTLDYDVHPSLEFPRDVVQLPGVALDSAAVSSLRRPAFKLSETFYGDPACFQRIDPLDSAGWRTQPMHKVSFPSAKGVLRQWATANKIPGTPVIEGCCNPGTPGAVVWADLSAVLIDYSELTLGVQYAYNPHGSGVSTPWNDGPPIDYTENGVLGRDR